jgi:NAD(P)-dependent dehydrogenase (short-subunit alcohol dehydrogenase family)
LLLAEGAEVIVSGRSQEKLDEALKLLGEGASGKAIDAGSSEQLLSFFEQVGSFQHLVISVSGAAGAGAFRELELSELRNGFEAKFWAQVAVAQASLKTIASDGSITFIGAGSSRTSRPGTAGLAAINGAIDAMIPPLATELRPLRVNAVSPGVIATPWWNNVSESFRDTVFAQEAAILPVGRVGQPEDVAQAIVFLIKNGFVTGTIIDCDGGARLK